MSPAYSREALRRLRERQTRVAQEPEDRPSALEQIPPDAPMDDATITVWNGERFVAWEKWLAAAPIECVGEPEVRPLSPTVATCITALCGGTHVSLVRDGERWLMFVGGRRAGNRRRDFASPFMEHAIRTAEAWYGTPAAGWQVEERRDGRQADEPRQSKPGGEALPDFHWAASAFSGTES